MRRGVVNKFNRGELDPRALMRDDVTKINNSAALMDNFLPIRLGPMTYRSGTLHIASAPGARMEPFVASTSDTAIIGVDTTAIKVWVDDVLVDQPSGVMTLSNETFDSNITSWTDASGAGSTAAWLTGGYANLTGAGTTSGKIHQTFGGSSYVGVEHCIQITIVEAPVLVKIGESGVDSTDIFEGVLEPGVHSLVFSPVAALPTVTLSNDKKYRALVDGVELGTDIDLSLPTPTTITDLTTLRQTQSADVLFVTASNGSPFKIERRGTKSWGLVPFRADDGPFGLVNNTDITLTAAALSGNTTLTASAALFTSASVGVLYKLTSAGQEVTASVTVQDTGTGSIRVTGVEDTRKFQISRTGTWAATVTLQRSVDDASWSDIETYTGNGTKTYDDGLDNSILYYRLWCKTGDFTSGTIELGLVYDAGSIDGAARVTAYTSTTVVDCQVLVEFGATDATRDWYEGEWGGTNGYPSANVLYEGRFWLGGKTKIWGSVSDQYQSFDADVEGDSRAIRRTIGFGPVDRVDWLAPSTRMLVGIASDVISVRSSSFGEVLSQDNVNLKSGSTQGAAPLAPIKIGDSILYVQRSGTRLLESSYTAELDTNASTDLTVLNPKICEDVIVRVAVSMQPEIRIYVVLANGDMRVYLLDHAENVSAWSRLTFPGGTVTDVVVLPGLVEDRVTLAVTRSGTSRMERMSRIENMVTEHVDSAQLYTSPGLTISDLSHLEGETVGVWADGQDRGTYTVASATITLTASWTSVTVGLPYVAQYRSNKIGQYVRGSVSGIQKRIVDLHLAMLNYWPGSVTHGPDFTDLEIMPEMEDGVVLDTTVLVTDYDEYPMEFVGDGEIDPRICLQATGPCEILAMTYDVQQDGLSTQQQQEFLGIGGLGNAPD